MRKKTAPSVFCHLTLVNVEMGFTWLFLFYVHTLVDCLFVFCFVFGLWLCSENSPGIRDGVFFHALTQSLQANPGTYKIFPQS